MEENNDVLGVPADYSGRSTPPVGEDAERPATPSRALAQQPSEVTSSKPFVTDAEVRSLCTMGPPEIDWANDIACEIFPNDVRDGNGKMVWPSPNTLDARYRIMASIHKDVSSMIRTRVVSVVDHYERELFRVRAEVDARRSQQEPQTDGEALRAGTPKP
jgi:hypothetical protein